MTLARGEREWALLVSEYNICKKKLESKRQALKILMGDLESCQRERDIYKNKIRQMQQDLDNFKKKEREQESKELRGIKSPTGQTARSPEHVKFKRERKLSGHSIWEQELQSVRERKNKTLSQLLCEAREENKALKNDFMDLRVLYREAQEDIILLRENVARQKASEKNTGKMDDLEARQDLIQHLEKNQEKMEELDREVQAITDEKNEIIIERDHHRDKVERLNTQLNFILGADDRRLVDIDAILMENRYQKEQIKQLKEELKISNASLTRQKAAIEKKKARLVKAGYNHHPSAFMGTGVKQALPSLISEISSSFGGGVSSATVNDLQSLANSLSESLSEKDIALLHQKNTNRILGHRVTELENKLKTLEVSGLWSLEGHRGYGSEEMIKLYLEKIKRSPHTSNSESESTPTADLNDETEIPSAESSPDLENMDSLFFGNGGGGDFGVDQDELVDVSSLVSVSEEEEESDHCRQNQYSDDEVLHDGISDCQLEESCSSESDSHLMGDSRNKGDSLWIEDSREPEDFHANSNFQSKEDSHVIENSQSKGVSHIIEVSRPKRNYNVIEDSNPKGDSNVIEDSHPKGDSYEESEEKGDSHSIEESHSKAEFGSTSVEVSLKNSYVNSTLKAHEKCFDNNNESLESNSYQSKDIIMELNGKSSNDITNSDTDSSKDDTNAEFLEDREWPCKWKIEISRQEQEDHKQELHELEMGSPTSSSKNDHYLSSENEGEQCSFDHSVEEETNLYGLNSNLPDV